MKACPTFFETVRLEAAGLWDQLDSNPNLAAPWHKLFLQVQSPRHVLSEQLQNADDAGATDASVCVDEETFQFEHNGEDFAEDHFRSLCNFGYSNKRVLHTIGFRGIGFKSTFSLGDLVELHTPTLSVGYHRKRFTEPVWLPEGRDTSGRTRVAVGISDQHRQEEVEKNLDEWLKSPVSLLFFRNIRRIRIGDRELVWESLGPGPVPESEWMALNGNADAPHLLVRSEDEAFPDEALEEIRRESVLGSGEDVDLPPCRVEIVSGAAGRLYAVLPTGVETALPFACNAPFIQDPARREIQSPDSSPTNRWLLQRIGKLAASAMCSWLGRPDLPRAERAWAYRLLPDVVHNYGSLQGVCGTRVQERFAEEISGRALLLTDEGELVLAKQSVAVPRRLFDIWPDGREIAKLEGQGRPALSREVKSADLRKLLHWDLVQKIEKSDFIDRLLAGGVPKPETWECLLKLWAYVAPDVGGYRFRRRAANFRIVPVQGQDVLRSADKTVRLGERKLLPSDEDWEFLGGWLAAIDRDWLAFLADARRDATEREDVRASKDLDAAHAVLEEMGLGRTSDAATAIEAAAERYFFEDGLSLQGCVRLAHIAAKLNARVGKSFRYMTADGELRAAEDGVLFDMDGSLGELVPVALGAQTLLHSGYLQEFSSCSREEWAGWISSGRSGLQRFIPLASTSNYIGRRNALEGELQRRGYAGPFEPRYRNPDFRVNDWDFGEAYWKHWQRLADEDPDVWTVIFERVLAEKAGFWTDKVSAEVVEQASNGHTRKAIRQGLVPGWVLRFRRLPCLRDGYGVPHKPEDLFRRTPDTEALLDVEPFVDGHLDRETSSTLLDLMGVQNTPTGPGRLLDRVRALARANSPPVDEVEKWYRRLDRMLAGCSTEDAREIRRAFRAEKLIFTQSGIWETASGVFRLSDATEVPGAEVVRSSVGDLQLWARVGVADRPTAELAIAWLNELPVGRALEQDDVRRVRSLLSAHPLRIWNECGHWLNLAGEWVAVDSLCRSHAVQQSFQWQHLHRWVLQESADLQVLSPEMVGDPPFSLLPSLASQVEDRLDRYSGPAAGGEKIEWLTVLGRELSRAEFDTEDETRRIRTVAQRLARTGMCYTSCLEIVPYIDGVPAGTARQADVVWLDDVLYVKYLSPAKLARRIPEEIGKAFERADILAALHYSFERSERDVRDYVAENFNLSAAIGDDDDVDLGGPAQRVDDPEYRSAGGDGEWDHAGAGSIKDDGERGSGLDGDDAEDIDGDESADRWETGTEEELPQQPTAGAVRRVRADIMDRYASSQGFRKVNDRRHLHKDGGCITRANGARFPWERYGADGELVRCYLPREHCLEREPLQIEADVWRLMELKPEVYALVLVDFEGGPTEVTGTRLMAMRAEGQVVLYPATYRLVFDEGHAG